MNNRYRRSIFQSGGQYHLFLDSRFSGYMQSHTHEFWQCVFVKQGHILQMHGSTKMHQQQGEFYITPPMCEHSLFAYGDDTVYYCLSFSDEIMREALDVYPSYAEAFAAEPLKFQLDERSIEKLNAMLNILMLNPIDKTSGVKSDGFHLTCAILITALSNITSIDMLPSRSGKTVIRQAAEYIDQHFFLDMTTDSIAEHFNMSRTSFYNQFIKEIGVTPKQYIKEKRFHEALRLMHDTDMPLHVIAEKVGYVDFSTFYRNFHHITGMSPSQYRSADKDE